MAELKKNFTSRGLCNCMVLALPGLESCWKCTPWVVLHEWWKARGWKGLDKVGAMRAGQVWLQCDPRCTLTFKEVLAVDGGTAELAKVDTGSGRGRVDCDKFLKRQRTASGYACVEDSVVPGLI